MKFFIIKKQHIMLALCVIIATALLVTGSVSIFASQNRKLPIYCVKTDKKQIAISFDAAWGNDDTQTLIDILKEYNVPATFFVVGAWVDKYPESVKALSDAGHRIENHSNTHPHMPQLSTEQMKNELESCNNKIKVLKRNAYGYQNFNRFRNRILHMFAYKQQLNIKQATAS